jgi:(p)ppGpp synthase/HD superfamily hydrolase
MTLTRLTLRFAQALQYAFELHAAQVRKGGDIPYMAHLLAVTALVLENGGDEDLAIAALLHDAAEDQGGQKILFAIRERFGERVAAIVEGCTDTVETPKPPWRPRKEAYIAHLRQASPDVLRVSLADKVHNARSILADLRQIGESTWDRFQGGKDGTLWYYRTLAQFYGEIDASPLVIEFIRVVEEIEKMAVQNERLPEPD